MKKLSKRLRARLRREGLRLAESIGQAGRVTKASETMRKASESAGMGPTLGGMLGLLVGMVAPDSGLTIQADDGKDLHLSKSDLQALGTHELARLVQELGQNELARAEAEAKKNEP